ncbi:glycosyl hydrolase catalytic core-domain-containing protein [Dioszegia hungarica]|uniref:Glycosyl hydrolase catalytic core-domain-containing protein n=1 Tax=Dioszegia hungarica TaxID=4972 RepID=A0AA38HFP4_9TREE|nr:glycosyl hydrolase catalytic core-domain-containing protein [Dioszegia hungarica]KAI9638734.1 glycosyl hydrolase catalytic core-domain-containing protein [Dioszegia hungarica]
MKTSALVPLLCLLAGATAFPDHSNADALARRLNPRRHHSSQVERMIENIKRQEATSSDEKTLAGKRIVNKRGQTCRVRPAAASASSSSSAAPSATSSDAAAASSAGAQADVNIGGVHIGVQVGGNAPASSAWSAPSAAASPSPAPQQHTPSPPASGGLTPNGRKAGISAGDALKEFENQIGWYYNWAPTDPWQSSNKVQFVPTLWGGGSADSTDAARLIDFKAMSSTPTWLIGPNEPDCEAGGQMSAGMTIDATASLWNELMAPKGNAGAMLLSPSMCKQMAEDGWLGQFQTKISRDWDITNVHINKNNMEGVKATIDYYYNKYKKPLWVTEFACVNDNPNFVPCTDQGQINQFIHDIVDVLQNDGRVYAYAYSNGNGLGNVWPLWNNGQLSESGKAYRSALSKYY